MSQIVIYKGIAVQPVERENGKIRVQSRNAADAQKAGLTFKEMDGMAAVFEAWAPEDELVPVDA